MYDAEHFFDGYKANPDYALVLPSTAPRRPARDWLVLCDTNGGTMPDEVIAIVGEGEGELPGRRSASTPTTIPSTPWRTALAAVRAGAAPDPGHHQRLGERCGNANLIAVISQPPAQDGLRDRLAGAMRV